MRCLLVSLSLLLLGLALVSAVDVDVRLKRQTQRVGVSKECTTAVNTFTSALSSAFPMVQRHNDFGAFIFKDPGWLVSSLYYRYTGSAWEWAVNQNGPFQPVSNRKVSSGIHSYLQPLGLTDISACNKYLMDKLQAANHPKPYAPPAPSDDKGIKALLDQLANAKGESKAAYCVMVRSKADIKSGKTCCKPDKASTDIHCCATTSGSSTDEHAENGPTPRGMYRMESKRQHPKYSIPWFNLERYQGGKFLGYDTKGTDGRYVFGFHPGQVSHGCVTVQATRGANGYEVGAGTCWSELEKRVDRGMIDVGHRGYMFVF